MFMVISASHLTTSKNTVFLVLKQRFCSYGTTKVSPKPGWMGGCALGHQLGWETCMNRAASRMFLYWRSGVKNGEWT